MRGGDVSAELSQFRGSFNISSALARRYVPARAINRIEEPS
jgi:hypothetical protein